MSLNRTHVSHWTPARCAQLHNSESVGIKATEAYAATQGDQQMALGYLQWMAQRLDRIEYHLARRDDDWMMDHRRWLVSLRGKRQAEKVSKAHRAAYRSMLRRLRIPEDCDHRLGGEFGVFWTSEDSMRQTWIHRGWDYENQLQAARRRTKQMRAIKTLDDLLELDGIGKSRLNKIRKAMENQE